MSTEKTCYKCGSKRAISEAGYQMNNCPHIYCVNCVYQELFINHIINLQIADSFQIKCRCQEGTLEISLTEMEDLFKKKYKIDTETTHEKDTCKTHGKEVMYFCKSCQRYICENCGVRNSGNLENINSSSHYTHDTIEIEKYANQFKMFLKDIQIQYKTTEDFVEKYDRWIEEFEKRVDLDANLLLKQIDETIEILLGIKEEYINLIKSKYSKASQTLKLIKLFYSNFYIDYENLDKINDIFVLKYLKNVNYEFSKIDFINESSNMKNMDHIKAEVNDMKANIDKILDYNFIFKEISRNYTPIDKLFGHKQTINTIIQLQDGKLCTGSSDFKIKFWETQEDGRFAECHTISSLTGEVLCILELKDRKLLTSTKDKSFAIKIWKNVKKLSLDDSSLQKDKKQHKININKCLTLADSRMSFASVINNSNYINVLDNDEDIEDY